MRLVELALQAERARDLRAHFLRFRRRRRPLRELRAKALFGHRGLVEVPERVERGRERRAWRRGGGSRHGERSRAGGDGERRRSFSSGTEGGAARPGADEARPRSRPCAGRAGIVDGACAASTRRVAATGGGSARLPLVAPRGRPRGSRRVRRAPSRCSRRGRAGCTARIPCTARAAPCACASRRPTIASTGHASMHSVQPMHAASSMRATQASQSPGSVERMRRPVSRERRDERVPAGRAAIDRAPAATPRRRRHPSCRSAALRLRNRVDRVGARASQRDLTGMRERLLALRCRAAAAWCDRRAPLSLPRVRPALFPPRRPSSTGRSCAVSPRGSARSLLALAGWKVVLAQPVPARCVVIFYPHTSNWDTVDRPLPQIHDGPRLPLRRQGLALPRAVPGAAARALGRRPGQSARADRVHRADGRRSSGATRSSASRSRPRARAAGPNSGSRASTTSRARPTCRWRSATSTIRRARSASAAISS